MTDYAAEWDAIPSPKAAPVKVANTTTRADILRISDKYARDEALAAFDAGKKYTPKQDESDYAAEWDALPVGGSPAGAGGSRGETVGEKVLRETDERYEQNRANLFAGAETGLSMITAPLAAFAGNVAGLWHGITGGNYGTQQGVQDAAQRAADVQQRLTFEPRTQQGKNWLNNLGAFLDATKVAGIGPVGQAEMAGTSAMRAPVARAPSAPRWVPPTTDPKTGKILTSGNVLPFGSVGSSAAASAERAQAIAAGASPEIRAEVQQAVQKGTLNVQAAERQVKADSLPKPIRLTEGEALGDPDKISQELNRRGKFPEFQKMLDQRNTDLIDNLNLIRDEAAPEVFEPTRAKMGQRIIAAYENLDKAALDEIGTKYQALRDANGGDLPIDVKTFVANTKAALKKEMLTNHVPPELAADLDAFEKSGAMNFEEFEAFRTNLARVQRTNHSTGGHIAGVIREQLEQLPLQAETKELKTLADEARAAAKARFDRIKADPAYKAVVEGKAAADNFINKYVVLGKSKDLAKMKEHLTGDVGAQQAMAAGAIRHLKEAAKVLDDKGNFAPGEYNKALRNLRESGKAEILFDPKIMAHLENLGEVADWTAQRSRGSYVNTSNTTVAALAEAAKGTAEGGVNAAFKGLPVGTIGRRIIQNVAERKAVRQSMRPGAGIQSPPVNNLATMGR